MCLVVAKKSRTFLSLPCSANGQVCRSWEGARPGSEPPLANGNIPYHGCHAQFRNGGWPRGRRESAVLFSLSSNALLAGSSSFSGGLVFSGSFANSRNPPFPGSAIATQGLAANQLSGGEKKCIVNSLVCIFFIISSSSSSSSNTSFVVLLNCLYLNPQVLPFVHFSCPSLGGGRGGVSEWLSGPSCRLPG